MSSNQAGGTVFIFGIMIMLIISAVSGASAAESQNIDPGIVCIFLAASLAIIGGIFGLIERSLQGRSVGERPVLYTVFGDPRIKHFSTTGIVSTIYSITSGSFIGLSISGLGIALLIYRKTYNIPYSVIPLLGSVLFVFYIFIIRIVAESYVVVFKVAQKYLNEDKN